VKREIIRVEPFDSNFEKWGVPVWTGPFDIEIECIAVRKD
jgi:hypothetical protein